MNFYKHYLGDYTRKTGHLSLAEHGAYRRLLDHYYATGKALPADLDALHRICGAISQPEQKAVSKVADEFFPIGEDGLRHNARADQELTGYANQADTNRRIAAEREAKRKENEQPNEPLDEPCCEGITNDQPKLEVRSQKLEVINQKPKKQAQAPFVLPDWIPQELWQAWVDGRKKARKPPTDFALRLAVRKLDNLREQGHPPAQVLMQSAMNGWADLFPVKEVR